MFLKKWLVFLVVYFLPEISYGQRDKKCFREDYTYIETSKGFYKIHTTPHNWTDARRVCAQEGASMFFPEDSDEVNAVISFWDRTQPTYARLFLGMSELMVPGVFETVDGKLLSEVYNKWVPGEPNNLGGVEHCVNMFNNADEITHKGLINDCPCNILEPFICKKSLQSLESNCHSNTYNLDGQRDKKCFREDYTYIETSKGFYKIHTTQHNWTDARRVCAQEGANMFFPEDSDEVKAVISFWDRTQPTYARLFLGMSELMVPGVFETVDGKLLSEVYNKWVPGEPNNLGGVEHCVNMFNNADEITHKGLINDCPCNILEPFICKKSLQSLESNCHSNTYNLDGQSQDKFFRKDYTYIETVEGFYKIHTTRHGNWFDAKRMCALEGASLFYPENDDEAHAVISFWNITQPNINEVYVGLSTLLIPELFESIDGKIISEVYNNWGPGEPDLTNADKCVLLNNHGLMAVTTCYNNHYFICKKSLQSVEWNSNCKMTNLDYTFNEDLGKCYKLYTTPLKWKDAYIACRTEQSYLAVIDTPMEAEYIVNLTETALSLGVYEKFQRGIYHLGFHNIFKQGWWTITGKRLTDAGAWLGNYQPDASDQKQCGSMFYTGRLNNIDCDTKSFFVCEHDVNNTELSQDESQTEIDVRLNNVKYL